MAEWWEYPKAKYHVDGRNCVVNNLAEELALDLHQWFDHPDKAKEGFKPAPTLEEKLEHEDYLAENPQIAQGKTSKPYKQWRSTMTRKEVEAVRAAAKDDGK